MSFQAVTWAIEQRAGGPSAKAVLWSIANYANDHWCAWPSQATIVEESEQSADSVQRRIPDLVERGLLRRVPLRLAGRRTVDFYILAPSPLFVAPLAEIEHHLPRGYSVDRKYVAAECGSVGEAEAGQSLSQSAATTLPQPLPQTLPQSAAHAAALLRQHEPVKEPGNQEERERAREATGEGLSDGLSGGEALKRALKLWPDAALQSEALARSSLEGLTPSERKTAVERIPVFLALHREKHGKAKLPYLHNYLGEKHRWSTLQEPPRAASPEERRSGLVEPFDRAWWWLFFDFVRRAGAALVTRHSPEASELRRHVSAARSRLAWRIDPSVRNQVETDASKLVQISVTGAAFDAWRKALWSKGVDLPEPDKAPFIFVPSGYPGEAEGEDIAKVAMEMA